MRDNFDVAKPLPTEHGLPGVLSMCYVCLCMCDNILYPLNPVTEYMTECINLNNCQVRS